MRVVKFNDHRLQESEFGAILKRGLVKLFNCRVLRKGEIIWEHLWFENGVIVNPEPIFYVQRRQPQLCIDCCGNILAPGYIDMQINGGFGVDFSSDANEIAGNVAAVAKELVKFGVTAFCPTIVSSSSLFYHTALGNMKHYEDPSGAASCLGLHLEGPFINRANKGAHADQHFVDGFSEGYSSLEQVYGRDLSRVAIVTLAPELPNSHSVIEELVKQGIKVSLGHSSASISIGETAVKSGASCITHLFNAMLPFHHRDPGLVGLLASSEIPAEKTLFFGIISDGVHTHDGTLRIAHKTNPNGLILVTDAVALLGFKEGMHKLGDMTIEIKNRKALIAGTSTITGSISPMDYCVRHFLNAARCDQCAALICATLHPAQFLGLDHKKGTLHFGADADFLVLSDSLHVMATFIGGSLCWTP